MSKRQKFRQQQEARKKKHRFLLLGLTAIVVVIAVFSFIFTRPVKFEAGDGILATPLTEYDFGSVSAKQGAVTTELPLANVGEEDLVISFLDSSCGCTSARVINNDKEGPIFGMSSHGKSPRNWQTVIKPGEQAKLKIYYDPMVHPDFRGPATRVVSISTNAKTTPLKKIKISINQTD